MEEDQSLPTRKRGACLLLRVQHVVGGTLPVHLKLKPMRRTSRRATYVVDHAVEEAQILPICTKGECLACCGLLRVRAYVAWQNANLGVFLQL